MKTFVTLIWFLTCFVACKRHNASSSEQQDSFVVDVPPNYKTKKAIDNHKRLDSTFGLENLMEGTSGIQIRVWQSLDSGRIKGLLVSDKEKQKSVNELQITIVYSDDGKKIDTIVHKRDLGEPKSGWRNFFDQLYSLHLDTIPDYKSLPNHYYDPDENATVIEYSNNKMYKLISYPDIHSRLHLSQAKQILRLMNLFSSEFQITAK
jgi:hypothetical protein